MNIRSILTKLFKTIDAEYYTLYMGDLLKQIASLVGPQGILYKNDVYARNAGIWRKDPILAEAIIRPACTQEASDVLKLCHQAKQPVVTHGGLTNLVHSADAQPGDLVISLERMNHIEEIDSVGRTISCEAGTILQNIQDAAAQAELYLPLDLGARGSCTIGGNIATNAGGNKVIRYGMTRDLVLGLEAVLADGTIVSSMNRLIKNNTGYDLKQLFIGSEGTLGIITRAVLRLREHPAQINTALLSSNRLEDILALLRFLDHHTSGQLCAFEVMWQHFYTIAAPSSPLTKNAPYYVLIETFSNDTSRLDEILADALQQNLISDAVIAKSEKERQQLWAIRDNVEALNQYKPIITFDISLPLSKIAWYTDTIQETLKSTYPNSQCFIFGHLGDNNLHIIVTPGEHNLDLTQVHENIEQIIYNPLSKCQGAISAEHGIGLEKKSYLSISRSDEEINMMRNIKRALDPNNILNPGKIFDL